MTLRAGLAINDSRVFVKRRHNRPLYAVFEVTFLWRARENLPEKSILDFRLPEFNFRLLDLGDFRLPASGIINFNNPGTSRTPLAHRLQRGRWRGPKRGRWASMAA